MSETAPGTRSLDDWLRYAERVHPMSIEMGLERVAAVAARLGFEAPAHRPAPRNVIVAGTNGKGSTCVALEALLRSHGLRVGTTLSPHVHRFNERVRVDGVEAGDAELCAAFVAVEQARGEVPLTYFEFSALVALYCFRAAALDVTVLEIGLGGRLDAFNLVSADVAVITSIGLDHQDYLGHDLEGIGREKAGIMRPGQTVVLGADVTASVVHEAARLTCPTRRLGVDFHVSERADGWDLTGASSVPGLRRGALAPHNCALAIDAARHLVELDAGRVAAALATAALPGRCERWRLPQHDVELLLDVAHNPSGAAFLGRTLDVLAPGRRYVAVLGMLVDKDPAGVVAALGERVQRWVGVATRGARGQSATALCARLGATRAEAATGALQGLERALSWCRPGDAILVLGSFSIVEQCRELLLDGSLPALPATTASPTAPTDAVMDSGR